MRTDSPAEWETLVNNVQDIEKVHVELASKIADFIDDQEGGEYNVYLNEAVKEHCQGVSLFDIMQAIIIMASYWSGASEEKLILTTLEGAVFAESLALRLEILSSQAEEAGKENKE